MGKRAVLVISLVVLVACAVFAQSESNFATIGFEKDGFSYHGIQFDKLLLMKFGTGVQFPIGSGETSGVTQYQSGTDTILVIKKKNSEVFEIPLRSVLYMSYSDRGKNLGLFFY